jgi:type IV pilus assembly protein PilM
MIYDAPLFTSALEDMLKAAGIKNTSPVVLGVNNENVIMRYATFPKVPDDKLKSVISMQAQDFIPVPVSELGLDYVVIDETVDDDDQPALNVLLVGAKNMMLENLVSNFESSKREVIDIDSSFLAWTRVAIKEAQPGSTFAFLKLTDDVLNFVAISDGDIKMVRSINIPDRAMVEVKKVFNEYNEVSPMELDVVNELLHSELSSSMNYFQMQTNILIDSVLFSATTPLEGNLAQALAEKAYVPLVVPSFYNEYMTSSFLPKNYAGCISLAKVALEG